jgi:hypothetical protein
MIKCLKPADWICRNVKPLLRAHGYTHPKLRSLISVLRISPTLGCFWSSWKSEDEVGGSQCCGVQECGEGL